MSKHQFTKEEIEKYQEYTYKYILPKDEIDGHCYQCGEFLKDVELPEGPEKEVVCLGCLNDFTTNYLEQKEQGFF